MAARVTSTLFDGAASRVILQDDAGGEEIEVSLPQSGEFAGLGRGAEVHIGWSGEQGNCFATANR